MSFVNKVTLLWTWKWTCWLHKRKIISWVIISFLSRICSMEKFKSFTVKAAYKGTTRDQIFSIADRFCLTLRRLMSYIYIYMEHPFLMFLGHTQRRSTDGRTPLDEWSARRRDLYLTTHDTHNRQISMPPVGFEPTISAGERPQVSS